MCDGLVSVYRLLVAGNLGSRLLLCAALFAFESLSFLLVPLRALLSMVGCLWQHNHAA